MFTQLAPLIRERPVMLTILAGAAAGEEIRLVITPQRIKDDDPPPTLENLAVTGTPEELDLELPEALAGWVRNRKTLVDQVDEAKKAAAANAQAAAQAEAAKKTTANARATTQSKATGKNNGSAHAAKPTNPDTVDGLMDAFGKKENEADPGATATTANSAAQVSASGRLDLEDMADSAQAANVGASADDDEGGWE